MEIDIKKLYRETEKFDGKEVVISGWIRNNRASNKFGFNALLKIMLEIEDLVQYPLIKNQ